MSTLQHSLPVPPTLVRDGEPYYSLSDAAAVREPDGSRRFGAESSLRRLVLSGRILASRHDDGIRYVIRVADLERYRLTRTSSGSDAQIARFEELAGNLAKRIGPLSDAQCERIAARLKAVI